MSEDHPTAPAEAVKPANPSKPYPDFPLFPHATKRWAKKIRGRMAYFGPWNDPDGALARYLEQKDALHAGKEPRSETGELTIKGLVNEFLAAKQARVDTGEMSQRTWNEYKTVADLLVKSFGKYRLVSDLAPSDFTALRTKMAKRWGPHRLTNTIQYIRSIFGRALKAELIDKPVRYGPDFDKPTKKTVRLHRARQGIKLFAPEEIHRLLGAANMPTRAMILLAINGGLGNS